MASYQHPDAYTERIAQAGSGAVEAVDTSTAIIYSTFGWGPINEPTKFRSFDSAFVDFGGYLEDETGGAPNYGMYEVEQFFIQAKLQAKTGVVYLVRLAKMTDVQIKDAVDATRASASHLSIAGADAPAIMAGTAAAATYLGGWPMEPGLQQLQLVYTDAVGPTDVTTDIIAYQEELATGVLPIPPLVTLTVPIGETWTFDIQTAENGQVYTVDFPGGGGGTTYTATEVVDMINQNVDLLEARHDLGTNFMYLTHDIGGTASYIRILPGATVGLTTAFGWTLGVDGLRGAVTPGSNVANNMSVTIAEIKALVEAESAGTILVNANRTPLRVNFYTALAGAVYEITFTDTGVFAGNLAFVDWGFSAAGVNETGSDGSVGTNMMKVWGKYYGTLGNHLSYTLKADPMRESRGAGSDLLVSGVLTDTKIKIPSTFGYQVGQILVIDDGTPINRIVTQLDRTFNAGTGLFDVYAHLDSALGDAFAAGTTTVASLEFTIMVYLDGRLVESAWSQLSQNPDADNYYETIVNDEDTGSGYIELEDLDIVPVPIALYGDGFPVAVATAVALTGATSERDGLTDVDRIGGSAGYSGLYAARSIWDAGLACMPGANAIVLTTAFDYMQTRADIFFVGDALDAEDPQSVVDNRIDSGYATEFGELWEPMIKVLDPIGKGKVPMKYIPPSGAIVGLKARVDKMSKAGDPAQVWEASAGEEDFGKLRGIYGLKYERDGDDQDILNPAGVNCIRKSPSKQPGIYAWGLRSLSTQKDFYQSNVCRLFIMLEQTAKRESTWALFRGNNVRAWNTSKERLISFLSRVRAAGGLAGDTDAEAFYVKLGVPDETMTQDDIDGGYQIGEFGAAPTKASEYVVWRVAYKKTTGVTVERSA